jgi:hypothetical protein
VQRLLESMSSTPHASVTATSTCSPTTRSAGPPLNALGVPARDAQVILGHSRLAVTLEIYTHTDDEAQLDALTRLHSLSYQA